MNPSGAITNPEPLPSISRAPCRLCRCCLMSMLTTEGATRSATLTTVREYSSSKVELSDVEPPVAAGDSGAEIASCNRRPSEGVPSFGKVAVVIMQISSCRHQQSTTYRSCLYDLSGVLLSSCTRWLELLEEGCAKTFLQRLGDGRAVSVPACARSHCR